MGRHEICSDITTVKKRTDLPVLIHTRDHSPKLNDRWAGVANDNRAEVGSSQVTHIAKLSTDYRITTEGSLLLDAPINLGTGRFTRAVASHDHGSLDPAVAILCRQRTARQLSPLAGIRIARIARNITRHIYSGRRHQPSNIQGSTREHAGRVNARRTTGLDVTGSVDVSTLYRGGGGDVVAG